MVPAEFYDIGVVPLKVPRAITILDCCLTGSLHRLAIREEPDSGSRESLRCVGSRAYTRRYTPSICGTAFPIICEQSLDNWLAPLHVPVSLYQRARPQTASLFEGSKLLAGQTACYICSLLLFLENNEAFNRLESLYPEFK